ncbi:Hsp20/alpha crystallin family protein [Roseateles saccharophilus]|uniref:Heat shock protein Hsp20 n=1 Tax=Roseateles saccharophilus TaxID=304 RepID=A0A4R3V528_ROSSA|nr:Hsp20/alpha crystallin family protein [Roseateles saccharophilus]MDG0831456.1 Hsp20/alpha crystallin family protein [Roseateles saccharophilus]TCU98661.1 heat shock protein Hsp20 [Roseateles saccharophilus]
MSYLPSVSGSLFDDLFRDFAPGYVVRPLHGDALPRQIRLDVKEDDGNYVVHAELPGVARDDIRVSIDGDVVSLSAEIKQHDQKKDEERVLRSERYYGAVSRSIRLPGDVDESRAAAKYDNGVLTLTLPKKPQAQGARSLRID